MNRNIIALIIALFVLLGCVTTAYAIASTPNINNEVNETTFSEDYIPSETTFPVDTEPTESTESEMVVIILDTVVVERVEPTTYDEANASLEKAIARQELTNTVYQGLITLGYADDHPAIIMAKTDIENADADVTYYQEQFEIWEEKRKWAERMEQNPVATQVWLYLKNEMGYSDHAAAGIIGNMMAECGGHTLELKWWIYNPSKHYGLCQWSAKYYPQMQGASLEEQLAFMKESFADVIERYGYLYKKGFTYNDFITMDNCGDAAIAFCKIYERPGGNQEYRRGLAQKAYEYFVG